MDDASRHLPEVSGALLQFAATMGALLGVVCYRPTYALQRRELCAPGHGGRLVEAKLVAMALPWRRSSTPA